MTQQPDEAHVQRREAEETADEVDDQDAGPASQPTGAAGEGTDAEAEDPDAGPASAPAGEDG